MPGHPPAPRSRRCRRRTGPGRDPDPAAPGGGVSAGGRRPPGCRRRPPAPPRAAGVVAVANLEGMVAIDGLLEAEAGHTVLAALEPLARPADADDRRKGG